MTWLYRTMLINNILKKDFVVKKFAVASLLCLGILFTITAANKKVIIDCDPGGDDTLALMLAVKSKVLDIQAITIVAGNEDLGDATVNSIYILHMLGASHIPAYSGASKPLSRTTVNPFVKTRK